MIVPYYYGKEFLQLTGAEKSIPLGYVGYTAEHVKIHQKPKNAIRYNEYIEKFYY